MGSEWADSQLRGLEKPLSWLKSPRVGLSRMESPESVRLELSLNRTESAESVPMASADSIA